MKARKKTCRRTLMPVSFFYLINSSRVLSLGDFLRIFVRQTKTVSFLGNRNRNCKNNLVEMNQINF